MAKNVSPASGARFLADGKTKIRGDSSLGKVIYDKFIWRVKQWMDQKVFCLLLLLLLLLPLLAAAAVADCW